MVGFFALLAVGAGRMSPAAPDLGEEQLDSAGEAILPDAPASGIAGETAVSAIHEALVAHEGETTEEDIPASPAAADIQAALEAASTTTTLESSTSTTTLE
jgi:hypothetical protein